MSAAALRWCTGVILAWGWAQAQTFDSASVKPAKPGTRGYSIQPLPGRLRAQNVTLKQMIAEAYHVYDFQVSGGPKWIDSDRYDVEGKAAGGETPNTKELRLMLRKLLEERFGLNVQEDRKEMPVIVLDLAKGGSKLARPAHPDAPVMFRVYQRRQITAENAPLDHLTEALTWLLGKPVLDKTGLEGSFDYKLEWAPDEVQVQSGEAPPQTDGSAPSLAAALGQFGFKLTARKDMVEEIVVERAERPAGN